MTDFTLIAGPCAVESDVVCLDIARQVKELCTRYGIRYIFKASYAKANRSKLDSFTGIEPQAALDILARVRAQVGVEVITDVHESPDPARVAPYVDHLQIPAFLCRQTALLLAAGATGLGVNIKKGQFMSPEAMGYAVEKVRAGGSDRIALCERGTTFGYQDLIVDASSMVRLRAHGVGAIMDCTHAVQKPNQTSGITGGDPDLIETLALSAVATGADGLFIEVHPEPAQASSDAQSMLRLDRLPAIVDKVVRLRAAMDWHQPLSGL